MKSEGPSLLHLAQAGADTGFLRELETFFEGGFIQGLIKGDKLNFMAGSA
jgi:hypothetical protein